MRKFFTGFGVLIFVFLAGSVSAVMPGANMMQSQNFATRTSDTPQSLNQLRQGEKSCADLSNEDFRMMGDYFMKQMVGENDEAMDELMAGMMGSNLRDQMFVVMGQRLSDCDTSATFMPMSGSFGGNVPLGGMMGGWNQGTGLNMMSGAGSGLQTGGWFAFANTAFVLWSVLLPLALVFLIIAYAIKILRSKK